MCLLRCVCACVHARARVLLTSSVADRGRFVLRPDLVGCVVIIIAITIISNIIIIIITTIITVITIITPFSYLHHCDKCQCLAHAGVYVCMFVCVCARARVSTCMRMCFRVQHAFFISHVYSLF